MTTTEVEVSAYIFSVATYSPGGGGGGGSDPVVSLVQCNASDPGQRWNFNSSSGLALPGSIVDGQQEQCLDVDGCNGQVGAALWMWPCVTSGSGSDCNATNQLWWWDAGSGWIISRMPSELCVTASARGPAAALSVEPCGAAGALQAFDVDAASGLVNLRGGGATAAAAAAAATTTASAALCLCSRRPGSGPNLDDTHVGLALRLGGMTPSSGGARAYESSWYDYGYYFSLRVDGSWAVTKGAQPPGDGGDGAAIGASGDADAAAERPRRSRRRSRRRERLPTSRPPLPRDPRIVLAQGALPSGGALQQWHILKFSATGATLTASIDGNVVAQVNDNTYPVGWAALTSGWHMASFSNFSMTHSYSV